MTEPLDLVVPNTKRGIARVTYGNANNKADTTFVVEWQPGNGTWYRLMFTPLTPKLVEAAGFDFGGNDGCYLITWCIPGEPGNSYVFQNGGFLHYEYVQEKLCSKKGSRVDASELTRIIALMLGRECKLCTDDTGHDALVFQQ